MILAISYGSATLYILVGRQSCELTNVCNDLCSPSMYVDGSIDNSHIHSTNI